MADAQPVVQPPSAAAVFLVLTVPPGGLRAAVREVLASAPVDLLLHVRAQRIDLCFELAQRLTEARSGRTPARSTRSMAFRSCDDRDLSGLVDGTENPEGAVQAVSVGGADPRMTDLHPAREG